MRFWDVNTINALKLLTFPNSIHLRNGRALIKCCRIENPLTAISFTVRVALNETALFL